SSSVRMGVIQLPNLSRILCFSFHIILILLQQTTAARELKFVIVVKENRKETSTLNVSSYFNLVVTHMLALQTGMQQLFELGQYMRKRYSNFLNSTYNRQEFYIQSTDYDRTIMSAQSYLSGLFPPTSSEIWNPELLWQPIPVHIFQKTTEQRLNFPLPNCPRFDELQRETQTSKEFQNRIQPYMDFLQTMAINTGLELNHLKILDNFQLWNTYDTLHCETCFRVCSRVKPHCKELQDSLKKSKLSSVSVDDRMMETSGLKIFFCVLVNIILNSIKQAVNSSKPRKMEVYSAVIYILTLHVSVNVILPEIFLLNIYVIRLLALHLKWYTCMSSINSLFIYFFFFTDIFIGFNVAVGLLSIFNLVLLYLLYHYGRCRHRNNYQDI
ncbi:PPAP phosphatase, partial [Chaetops frenatus]|nr:PPAP phosphatase [Chaetops frenatus]